YAFIGLISGQKFV
ncbi:unnamed protein product, partial [Allacma fusca]